MNVLVLGSGAREHALAAALARSASCDAVWVAPGNAGMRDVARCLDVRLDDFAGLTYAVRREGIDLTVAGSEEPLVGGVWDWFDAQGLRLIGPSRQAARLEGSKVFAKQFMRRHGIPTADFEVFDDYDVAVQALSKRTRPCVIKADGLAAGKGVHMAPDAATREASLRAMLVERRYGDAGATVVVEETLRGPELSVFALCDGNNFRILGMARDHKRAHDGDTGPNTGGMGAFSPVPGLDADLEAEIVSQVFAPVLSGMVDEGTPYRGFLYAGLMLTADGPRVLEFNCRLGDPEAQVLLPRLRGDFLALLRAADQGDVSAADLEVDPASVVGVVLASPGYPDSPRTGLPLVGLEAARAAGAQVFCAGVREQDGVLQTTGGRICTVVGQGADLDAARRIAYAAVARLEVPGGFYRRDIALLPARSEAWPEARDAGPVGSGR